MHRRQLLVCLSLILILIVSCLTIRNILNDKLEQHSQGCHFPTQDYTATNQSVPFLIIVAEARSGSTWLESFFKENENVLDFFEPLDARAFAAKLEIEEESLTTEEYNRIKLSILSNECQCQFSNVKYPSMGERASWSKSLHRLQGYLDANGAVLPELRKSKSTELKATLKSATPNDLVAVEAMCRRMDLVSAKVIRLRDISILSKLPELGCRNFKIIHLIRDPRPIIQSRMATFGELLTGNGGKSSEFSEEDIGDVARDICATYQYNARVGLTEQFRHSYRIVKYEDIASDPMGYAKLLYEFAGLELTAAIEDYIRTSSSGSIVQGKYEVVRNTAEVVENWKKVMDPSHVKIVESQCEELFQTFGYDVL